MLGYEVEMVGFEEQIKNLEGFDQVADRHLRSAMWGSVTAIQSAARREAPVFRGRLRNAIAAKVTGFGGSIVGEVGVSMGSEDYPAVMEFGRPPGPMPPPASLERWVKLKLGVPDNRVGHVAVLVARAIGRRGIKGRYYLRKGLATSKVRIGMLFRDAVERIVRDLKV